MKHNQLSYIEKLENLYVLMETRQMLQNKCKDISDSDPGYKVIQDDLKKIDEEILEYTNGQNVETFIAPVSTGIVSPDLFVADDYD